MRSEVSVERQFRFHCSCGAITITGERTVVCTGCGKTLGVRRVRRRRQCRDIVTYYGRTLNGRTLKVRRVKKRRQHLHTTAAAAIMSRFSAWVKSARANYIKPLKVHRITEPGQSSNPSQPAKGGLDLSNFTLQELMTVLGSVYLSFLEEEPNAEEAAEMRELCDEIERRRQDRGSRTRVGRLTTEQGESY